MRERIKLITSHARGVASKTIKKEWPSIPRNFAVDLLLTVGFIVACHGAFLFAIWDGVIETVGIAVGHHVIVIGTTIFVELQRLEPEAEYLASSVAEKLPELEKFV